MASTKICKVIKFYQDDEDEKEHPECYQLIAYFDKREITTNCGDFYYDLSFNFDDFFKFAKYVEEQDKIYNKRKDTK